MVFHCLANRATHFNASCGSLKACLLGGRRVKEDNTPKLNDIGVMRKFIIYVTLTPGSCGAVRAI